MKSRIWLLGGALFLVFALVGCAGMVATANHWTAKLTGADDPNNKGHLAEVGRFSNEMNNKALSIAGIAPAASAPTK